jgi:CRP-like cAMP-binding protein
MMVGEMTQTDILQTLRAHPFTAGLAEPQLTALAGIAELATMEAHQTIFGSGERSKFFYLLISGTAFLEFQTPVFTICIQQLGPGDAFGWSALIDEQYRAFQVRTRADCRVLRISGDRLLEECQQDSALGADVFRRLSGLIAGRLRAAETRFAEFCTRDTESQVPV